MRAFLRRSTPSLASLPRSAAPSARFTPRISSQLHRSPSALRHYAIPSNPPEEPGKPDNKDKIDPKADSQPGKDAQPNANFTPLTKEEEELLQKLMVQLTQGMPPGMARALEKDVSAVMAEIKKQGLPAELHEVFKLMREGKPIDLITAAQVLKSVQYPSTGKAKRPQVPPPDIKAEYKRNFSGGQKPDPKNDKGGNGWRDLDIKFDTNTFLLSALLAYLTYRMLIPGENSREITWQEFRTTFLDKGLVEKVVVVNGNRARVYLHREAVASMYPDSPAVHGNFHYYFSIGSVEAFERKMDDAQRELRVPSAERIPVAYTDDVPWLATVLSFGPTLLFIGAIVWLSRRAASSGGGQSGIFGMGRSRAKRFNHETDVKMKFSDVAGMDEAKQEIMEFVSFLKEPGMFQKLGAKIPRGAILSGPPGTGKTLLAKATAGESGVPFYSVSGSEFVEMFVGVGPSRVRDLFATARKNAPCIIFIDEIDAIGKSRAKQSFGGGNDERESTLNQILTEMDGFNTSEQVVVIAGTNRPDILDKALLRPGRFDRHIAIDKPTMEGRKQIFAVHLKKIVTKEDIEHLKGRLAALTPGFSGADIANCVNEAALIAARHHAESVELKHFEQAIERVIGGLEKKSLVLNPEEKKTVAYHEAGHAICGWYLKYADPLLKVSIIPRGQGALGYAQYLPSGDTYLLNVRQLQDKMTMILGGRVSEELHFETVTSGASDDFRKVTQLATAMVTRFGMSRKIGFVSFEDDSQQQLHKPFSEETAKNIDAEVRRIVDEAHTACKELLGSKMKEIGLVAEELLRKEMLTRDDMVRLLGKRPFPDDTEFAKYFSGDPIAPPSEKIPGTEADLPGNDTPPTGGPVATFKREDVL